MIPDRPSPSRRRIRRALLLLILLATLLVGTVVGLYPFLSPNRPADSPIVVIEGWIADGPLAELLAWTETNNVTTLYLTGGPITTGSWLAPWKSYPEMTLARLEALGVADHYTVRAFPAPETRKDRTYIAAVALRDALAPDNIPASFTLASEAPHIRRSAHLFRRAFGGNCEIGTLPLTPTDFDRSDWYRSSAGVRTVLSEALALPYAYLARPSS
jgi:hypothetical protein